MVDSEPHSHSRLQVWRLAWVLLAHKDILKTARFEEVPIFDEAIRQLDWAADYLQKIHFKNANGTRYDSLVIQIGDRNLDHLITEGRPLTPEELSTPASAASRNVSRPVFVLSNKSGGSDLLSEAVCAFAALATLYAEVDPPRSVHLMAHATDAWGQLESWIKVCCWGLTKQHRLMPTFLCKRHLP